MFLINGAAISGMHLSAASLQVLTVESIWNKLIFGI